MSIQQVTFDCEVITPMFLGGTNQNMPGASTPINSSSDAVVEEIKPHGRVSEANEERDNKSIISNPPG